MVTTTVKLSSARARAARTVELGFNDESCRTVDVAPLLRGPVFARVAENDDAFAELFFGPELGTICWPNDADIAPETLVRLPDIEVR